MELRRSLMLVAINNEICIKFRSSGMFNFSIIAAMLSKRTMQHAATKAHRLMKVLPLITQKHREKFSVSVPSVAIAQYGTFRGSVRRNRSLICILQPGS
jgi:hypothetical protein